MKSNKINKIDTDPHQTEIPGQADDTINMENNFGDILAKLNPVNYKAALEAILFAAGYPVTFDKISSALNISIKEVKELVKNFQIEYNSYENRGTMVLVFENSCQICTSEVYMPYIRTALGIKRGGNLSSASLEVLATIAYNQPVTRAFIDAVRGVDSTYATNSLIERQLIEPCGRLDAPGRPMQYRTTENFLRCFGLSSLSELPTAEKLSLPSDAKLEIELSNEIFE